MDFSFNAKVFILSAGLQVNACEASSRRDTNGMFSPCLVG